MGKVKLGTLMFDRMAGHPWYSQECKKLKRKSLIQSKWQQRWIGTWMWWASMDGILEGFLFYPLHYLKVFPMITTHSSLWSVLSTGLQSKLVQIFLNTHKSKFNIQIFLHYSKVKDSQHNNISGYHSLLCSIESGAFCYCLKRLVTSAVLSTFTSLSSLNKNTGETLKS